MLRIGTVVMGVTDMARATTFWCEALDYVPREDPDDDWVVLVPRTGPGAALALGRSDTPVQEHPRMHLDLYPDDQAAQIRRLVALGAREVDWDLYADDPDFVVLADTEGNLFCVIDTEHG